jgi:hypothetical protein
VTLFLSTRGCECYQKDPPQWKSICTWCKQFETESAVSEESCSSITGKTMQHQYQEPADSRLIGTWRVSYTITFCQPYKGWRASAPVHFTKTSYEEFKLYNCLKYLLYSGLPCRISGTVPVEYLSNSISTALCNIIPTPANLDKIYNCATTGRRSGTICQEQRAR